LQELLERPSRQAAVCLGGKENQTMLTVLRSRLGKRLKDYGERLHPMPPTPPAETHRLTWDASERPLDQHFEESPTRPVKLPENVERLEALERDGIVFIE